MNTDYYLLKHGYQKQQAFFETRHSPRNETPFEASRNVSLGPFFLLPNPVARQQHWCKSKHRAGAKGSRLIVEQPAATGCECKCRREMKAVAVYVPPFLPLGTVLTLPKELRY